MSDRYDFVETGHEAFDVTDSRGTRREMVLRGVTAFGVGHASYLGRVVAGDLVSRGGRDYARLDARRGVVSPGSLVLLRHGRRDPGDVTGGNAPTMSDEKIWGSDAVKKLSRILQVATPMSIEWCDRTANETVDAIGTAIDQAVANENERRMSGPLSDRDESDLALLKIREVVQAASGESALDAVRRYAQVRESLSRRVEIMEKVIERVRRSLETPEGMLTERRADDVMAELKKAQSESTFDSYDGGHLREALGAISDESTLSAAKRVVGERDRMARSYRAALKKLGDLREAVMDAADQVP